MIRSELVFEESRFPTGEIHIRIASEPAVVDFQWVYDGDASIIELLMFSNALKERGSGIGTLTIPYVPYCRQDRVCNPGEAFSLKVFAGLVNSIGAKRVVVLDHHSDVTTALIENISVIEQNKIFYGVLAGKKQFYLVSPDAGAAKKTFKAAGDHDVLGVINFTKQRDIKTGEILGLDARLPGSNPEVEYVILDDICDGGKTFIEIAKILKGLSPKKITLCVTHGFFTKGLGGFDGLIDEIHTHKGKIK